MQITLPDKVKLIIKTLQDEGFNAYAVGGCVRDSLLGRIPNDWDITTDAKPFEIKKLFRRTIDTGIEHGTVTVMFDKEGFEITTYRIDGAYEDLRHPKEVTFTDNLREDLKRRDFTINAMAYNDKEGLVDMFGGVEDLNNGIIRAVGNPMERFGEDALRILRAVRFSAQLDYEIEESTYYAIKELAGTLSKISAERIRVEIEKLLVSKHPEKLHTAYEAGITQIILPEYDLMVDTLQNTPHHAYNVGIHTIETLKYSTNFDDKINAEEKRLLRLTMFMHDFGKPAARNTDEAGVDHFYGHGDYSEEIALKVLRRLKYDNDTIRKVRKLVKYHDYRKKLTEATVRRTIVQITPELIPIWFMIRECDIYGQSDYERENKLLVVEKFKAIYNKIMEQGDCLSIKDLKISGNDLIELGISRGPRIGEILNQLFEDVLNKPSHNDKEYLLNLVQNEYIETN